MTVPAALFALAALALGQALQVADGFYAPRALALLTAALASCAVGVILTRRSQASVRAVAPLVALIVAGIALQLTELLVAAPGMYLRPDANLSLFRAGLLAQALAVAAALVPHPFVRRTWFPVVLTVHVLLGGWMLDASPDPRIDVVTVHRAAIRALTHGRNPYRITFRNIYGDTTFYNPALVEGERVLFGYPYPPLTLLLAVPGQACCGDYRYAQVAATAIGAAAIGWSAPTIVAPLAATLFLTTPRMFFVLEQGWTEPMGVMLLGALLWTARRRPALASLASGLLVVTKQYLAVVVPLIVRFAFADRRHTLGFLVWACAAAAIVTVPFLVWNPRAFVDTVVLLQASEPFRIDSLSYVSWLARAGWGHASIFWSLAAAAAAIGVVLTATPNTPAGLMAGSSFALLATLAFGSKAFCNYYFLVLGALSCTVAATAAAASETTA